jgi:hypothetical protein
MATRGKSCLSKPGIISFEYSSFTLFHFFCLSSLCFYLLLYSLS